MYYYSAFGLSIGSDIFFPELIAIEINGQPDVVIELGVTAKDLPNGALVGEDLWITQSQCLQHIKNVANYYAENGNLIIVEPHPNSDEKNMRIYILFSTMAAIIHQRGMIPLHASGFLTEKGVVLIIGDSGAGKSTTIKALMDKEFRIFTDDVCVVKSIENKVFGTPSYPMIKLWENSLDLLRVELKKEEHRIWPDVNKYAYFFHDQFTSSWKMIWKIFVLETNETKNEPYIERLSSFRAFEIIGQNTYRGEYIIPMNLNKLHFDIISNLARQCPVYKICRPAGRDTIESVVQLIESEV